MEDSGPAAPSGKLSHAAALGLAIDEVPLRHAAQEATVRTWRRVFSVATVQRRAVKNPRRKAANAAADSLIPTVPQKPLAASLRTVNQMSRNRPCPPPPSSPLLLSSMRGAGLGTRQEMV